MDKNGSGCDDTSTESMEVRPVGVEPTTYGFEVRHSIQLSYGRHEHVV
jgi:hypothetical protein